METNSSQALPVCRVQSAEGSKERIEQNIVNNGTVHHQVNIANNTKNINIEDLFAEDVPRKELSWQEKEDGRGKGKRIKDEGLSRDIISSNSVLISVPVYNAEMSIRKVKMNCETCRHDGFNAPCGVCNQSTYPYWEAKGEGK